METILGVLGCLFIALLPTTLCSLLVWWADRYERESWWLMAVSFLWGSLPAVAFAAAAQTIARIVYVFWSPDQAIFWLLVVWGPLTEELFKGLAVWGLFVFYRTQFDGVMDGLIYGLLIGFGFSMTEDFIYYSRALFGNGSVDVAVLAVIRGILFATNHSVYTGLIGLGFGLATLSKTNMGRSGWPFLGLVSAIALHSAHNLCSLVGTAEGSPSWFRVVSFLWSVLVAFSWMLAIIVVIRMAWHHQIRIIKRELSPEIGKILTLEELSGICKRWSFPITPTSQVATRRRRLVQLALRRNRLRLTGRDREPALAKLTASEYQSLLDHFKQTQPVKSDSPSCY